MNDTAITAVGKSPLLIGFNYPWAFEAFGFYFGPHHREGEADVPDALLDSWPKYFASNLEVLREKYGVWVIRIFLLCNSHNWGGVDSMGIWHPPNSLNPKFLADLHAMLAAIKAQGMMVIPSLLDFQIADPNSRSEKRYSIVSDPIVSSVFFDQVLEPFLDVAKQYESTIWAWEVMNEPVWMTNQIWPNGKLARPAMSKDQLNRFLEDAVARIAKKGFLSTVGHRYFSDLDDLVTGSVHQFHFYPKYRLSVVTPFTDPAELPTYDASNPAILGEFGASADHGDPWSELKGMDAGSARERVAHRFMAAERKNYRLAMLWPDERWDKVETGDQIKLSTDAAAGLEFFARWRPRPKKPGPST